jgi:hypothetical protein
MSDLEETPAQERAEKIKNFSALYADDRTGSSSASGICCG